MSTLRAVFSLIFNIMRYITFIIYNLVTSIALKTDHRLGLLTPEESTLQVLYLLYDNTMAGYFT